MDFNFDENLLTDIVNICKSYGFDISNEIVINKYSEPHRYWHVLDHLFDIVKEIKNLFQKNEINKKEYEILVISTIFHDIVYDTKSHFNEENSVEFMMSTFNPKMVEINININDDIKKITNIILGTKSHKSKNKLEKIFNDLDTSVLDSSFVDLLRWENKIYKEFKWVGWDVYKKKRIEILSELMKDHPNNILNIQNLISFINNKLPKIGVCYYEIDKLPNIEDYIEYNKKIHKLFDNIIILIIYKIFDKNKLKEYSNNRKENQEFFSLHEDLISKWYNNYIYDHGYITIVKEHKYMNLYNEKINNFFIDNNIRVIYI